MSNRIFQAVWDHGPDDRLRMLVLMALADCADAVSGECFPSFQHIADAARCSRRAAIGAVRRLEADGWFSVERNRERPNGSDTSNKYRINLARLGLDADPGQRRRDRLNGGGSRCTPAGAAAAPLPVQPLHSLPVQPLHPHNKPERTKGPAALSLDFDLKDRVSRSLACSDGVGGSAVCTRSVSDPVQMVNGVPFAPLGWVVLSDLLRVQRSALLSPSGNVLVNGRYVFEGSPERLRVAKLLASQDA